MHLTRRDFLAGAATATLPVEGHGLTHATQRASRSKGATYATQRPRDRMADPTDLAYLSRRRAVDRAGHVPRPAPRHTVRRQGHALHPRNKDDGEYAGAAGLRARLRRHGRRAAEGG